MSDLGSGRGTFLRGASSLMGEGTSIWTDWEGSRVATAEASSSNLIQELLVASESGEDSLEAESDVGDESSRGTACTMA